MDGVADTPDFSTLQDDLYSAVIADILDDLGFRHQAMSHEIRPIDPATKLVGRAYTVLATDVCEMPDDPYLKELEAVDSLSKDDVIVAAINGTTVCGLWGELLSTAALSKGARGAIVDGFTRDSNAIIDLKFPVFARGYSPLDSKGRTDVSAHGVPIECGGVRVETGDILFADRDGVVVVPLKVENEVMLKSAEKVNGENKMRRALQNGMGVVEAYHEYGIL